MKLYDSFREIDRFYHKMKDLHDQWHDADYWADNFEIATKDIREQMQQKLIGLEIEIRELALDFVKGEKKNESI